MKLKFPILLLLVLLPGSFLRAEPAAATEGYKKEIQVTPLLRTTTTSIGQPLVYPKTDHPEITAVLVEIPSGAETGWHSHPFPCLAYIISGTLDVEIANGPTNQLVAGQAMTESINVLHNGKNNHPEPVKLVMFVMGETDKPFTERAKP
jgi:quercetin dioxygenase-like cupin family protein